MLPNDQSTPPFDPRQARSSPARSSHSPRSQGRPGKSPYPRDIHALPYTRVDPRSSPMPPVYYEQAFLGFDRSSLCPIRGDQLVSRGFHGPSMSAYYSPEISGLISLPHSYMPEIPTGWDHPPTSTSSPYHHEDDLAYTVKASATVMASNSQKPTALDQADHRVADYPFPMTPGPSPYYSPAVTPNLVPMSTPNLSAEVYRENFYASDGSEGHSEQAHLISSTVASPSPGWPNVPFPSGMGAFIPQSRYCPHTKADNQRYVKDVSLRCPIDFWMAGFIECGIPLSNALRGDDRQLQNGDMAVFPSNVGPSISIRLEWPGYRSWTRQIPTKDFRSPPNPITRSKLAKQIAKCVRIFIRERQDKDVQGDNRRWRVGTSADCIQFQDLVLVSVHHVSLGSWQPQLRLRNSLP